MEEEVEDLLPCPRATLACLALPPQRRRRRFLEKFRDHHSQTSLEQSAQAPHCGSGGRPEYLIEALNNSRCLICCPSNILRAASKPARGNLQAESAKLRRAICLLVPKRRRHGPVPPFLV
ncbi:hypothetical protein OIU84_024526 [Salix udensis]|uniref:Uncharacterized protein n=1 Tax=Salix udensis TaxID=889485 RepID=A0AAD6KHG5_9ROSI|nr:hypothetical protein OIU84_024526 [Salix udensis]